MLARGEISKRIYGAESRKAEETRDRAANPDIDKWKQWQHETMTPLETFTRQMEDLDWAIFKGLDKSVAGRMGMKAQSEFAHSGMGPASLPDLLQRGTMQEYSARVSFQNGAESPQVALLKEAQSQTRALTRIQNAVEHERQEVLRAP
jgi:hypothetical protein